MNLNNTLIKSDNPPTTTAQLIFEPLAKVNWNAPWLAHVPAYLRNVQLYMVDNGFADTSLTLADRLNQLLVDLQQPMCTGMGKPLSFITQVEFDKLNAVAEATAIAYESHIAKTGQIPTRDNLHDLFNAWVWFTFPQTKAMLNRYQATQIARDGIHNARGRVRDAITIFDESGAVFVTSDASVAQALQNFDWQNALVNSRPYWDNPLSLKQIKEATTAVYIFGHATLEQLVEPRKPICSHCKIVLIDEDFFELSLPERLAYLDDRLVVEVANWLDNDDVTPRDLSPLPILGIPHFWAENADRTFYEDTFVFRSGRRKAK